MIRTFAFALLISAVCAPALAQEADDDLARAHFDSGSAYYAQGAYEDAAREFLESYRLSARPELLENASRAYERALLFDDAIAMLERLLADHPEHLQRATLEERIANLRRLRERVSGGGGGGDDGGGGEGGDGGGGAGSSDGGISIPGVIVLSLGGAIGLTSIITGAVSHTMFEDLQVDCADGCFGRQGDIDSGNALAITSTVTMFAGIAAIAVGVVLLVVDSGGGGTESAGLRLVPGPGDAGLALRGTL